MIKTTLNRLGLLVIVGLSFGACAGVGSAEAVFGANHNEMKGEEVGTGGGDAGGVDAVADVALDTGADGAGPEAGSDAAVAADAAQSCAHDLCETGTALGATCAPCVAAVCDVLPGCCADMWNASCAGATESACGGMLCGDTAACSHSVCEVGVALPGGLTDACSLCVARVCENLDPACCIDAWDATCVSLVAQADCAISCE